MKPWRILRRLQLLEDELKVANARIDSYAKWCSAYAEREKEQNAATVHTQDQLTKLKRRVETIESIPRCGHAECSGYEGCVRNSGGD
jgi:hypothetical protein